LGGGLRLIYCKQFPICFLPSYAGIRGKNPKAESIGGVAAARLMKHHHHRGARVERSEGKRRMAREIDKLPIPTVFSIRHNINLVHHLINCRTTRPAPRIQLPRPSTSLPPRRIHQLRTTHLRHSIHTIIQHRILLLRNTRRTTIRHSIRDTIKSELIVELIAVTGTSW